MEGERARAPSLPDTHGRIGGGKEGGRRVGKRRGRHRKSPFINTSPSKKRVRTTVQNLAEYHLERANVKFQTNLRVHKRVSVCLVSRLSGANDNKETGDWGSLKG